MVSQHQTHIMAEKKVKVKKIQRTFDPEDNQPDFKSDNEEAELLKKELSANFLVNDHLIECVECHAKTLFDASSMNACLAS